jgi:FtsP/CotA-like multicopper oxidase with cupredoxin domain
LDPSLYCIELVPVPALRRVSGVAELGRARSPFGAAVTADGVQVYDVSFTLAGLPRPESLGPFKAFVAWVTTPDLDPMIRLGPVTNGRTAVGSVGLNKFIVQVTAEASPDVTEQRGRLVLRGTSPSMLMLPHDISLLPAQDSRAHQHNHESGGEGGWRMPPMHRAVRRMIPGLERLKPRVAPLLPGAGGDTTAIPAARPRQLASLHDGDTLFLGAGLVRRTIAGRHVTLYGFNGQYPGPLIEVTERATITVVFTNRLDQPSTVHWHGVRLDNRFDGVPGVTQPPVPPGGSYRYQVHFPDPGIYWYHPHVREDIQQDLGLYGNLLVRPRDRDYLGPANREIVLMLDDLLMDDTGLLPYGRDVATHALMGRFGNVLLLNGEPDWRLGVNRGEVVRFYLTNVASARTFNISLAGAGARLKLIGSDLGRFEREEWVESVVIAPAERYIVEARFDRPGVATLENRVQAIDHATGVFLPEVDTLGRVAVDTAAAVPDLREGFSRLREHSEVERYRRHFGRPIDHELELTLSIHNLPFGLIQVMRLDTAYVNPVEWNATMPMMDWLPAAGEVEWVLRDRRTGRTNMAIDWRFRRGEIVKLRLRNDRHTLHPMAHPIHVHGQRFLVLAQGGVPNHNLVWKDTVLLPVGQTADILIEMTNPGRWMLHCHVTEHLGAGMHTVFTVD